LQGIRLLSLGPSREQVAAAVAADAEVARIMQGRQFVFSPRTKQPRPVTVTTKKVRFSDHVEDATHISMVHKPPRHHGSGNGQSISFAKKRRHRRRQAALGFVPVNTIDA
jgi:nitrogen fixation protein FixH